jgi:hypothetical protein
MPGWKQPEVENRITRLAQSWLNAESLVWESEIRTVKSTEPLEYPHEWGCHLLIIGCEQEFGCALLDVSPDNTIRELVTNILTRPTENSPEDEYRYEEENDEPISGLELISEE